MKNELKRLPPSRQDCRERREYPSVKMILQGEYLTKIGLQQPGGANAF